MNTTKQFDSEFDTPLQAIGGEKLAGSGFENEDPEPDFSELEAAHNAAGRD